MSMPDPSTGPHFAPHAPRCIGHNQRGQPCKNPAIAGGAVCHSHGGAAPQVKASARERLMALQPLAIQTIHNLMRRDEFPTVQLGAAKDVLDRTDGKALDSVRLLGDDDSPLVITWKVPREKVEEG